MIPRYETFELTLRGPETGNPFTEVDLSAVFTYRNQRCYVPGFYDGGGVYRIRFMPTIEGEWHYVTRCNVPAMDGQSGSFVCGPAMAGKHGPVRVAKRFHFAYDDGTPFYPVGTTAYAWTSQEPETVSKTLDTLRSAPFNKIRMSPFPKYYIYNTNEPPLYPFEGGLREGKTNADATAKPWTVGSMPSEAYAFDFSRPNAAFWQYFEGLVRQLDGMGIQCDLILFHPYDRWGFASMSREDNLRYLRYVVARLSSMPNVWWSMANEWDLFPYRTLEDWEAYAAEVVQWDPVQHLRSIHNCVRIYDQSSSWITHVSMQRVDYHSHADQTARMRRQYQKPIMFDEICYEGDIDSGFGNITGEEMTKRFWDITVRGGYGTHGETYLREDEVLWWAKGGELTGSSPARLGFLRQILEDAPDYIDPRGSQEWDLAWGVSGWRHQEEADTPEGRVKMEYAQWMLCYFSFARPRFRIFRLPENLRYQIDVIDTWNMTITTLPGEYSGSVRVELPGRQYMAVRFRAVEPETQQP